jgi:hypothetical protein
MEANSSKHMALSTGNCVVSSGPVHAIVQGSVAQAETFELCHARGRCLPGMSRYSHRVCMQKYLVRGMRDLRGYWVDLSAKQQSGARAVPILEFSLQLPVESACTTAWLSSGSRHWGSGQLSRHQSCVIHHDDGSTSQAAVSQHSFLCSTMLFFGSSAYSFAVRRSISRLGISGLFLCCHNNHRSHTSEGFSEFVFFN